MDWQSVLASGSISSLIIIIFIFLFQTIIKNFFTNAIKHDYNIKLEELKSELKESENNISTLREGALSGVTNRHSKLYERQIIAVEELWNIIINLSKAKHISTTLIPFSNNFERVAEIAKNDGKIREFFKTLEGDFDITKINFQEGDKQRPFLTPLAWAYFSAFRSILTNDIIKFNLLKFGVGSDLLKDDSKLIEILEVALPDQKDYINNKKITSYYDLLEILENRLLEELKDILKGEKNDNENIELSALIMNKVKKIHESKK